MPNHRKPTTVSTGRAILGAAAFITLAGAGAFLVQAPDQPAPSAPATAVTVPSPIPIPERSLPAVKVVPPVVVTPTPVQVTAPVIVTTVPATPSLAKTAPPKTRPATAPSTSAKPPAHSEIVTPAGTLYCDNGYQHADGTCSSTPEYPTFTPAPASNPCSGTASQCLDATGGLINDISRLLGSGTP